MALRLLEQVSSDDYIQLITNRNITKRAWMVLFMIPMHVTNLNAESDPKVSDAG